MNNQNMDEQAPQPQGLPPTPNDVDTAVPKPETARHRYLIAAVLILLAIGLGSWVWHNQVPKLFPTPTSNDGSPTSITPTTDQQLTSSSTALIFNDQDQGKELLAKAVNSATMDLILADIKEVGETSQITLKDGKYEYNSNACLPVGPCTIRLGKVEYHDIDNDSDLDIFAQSSHWTGGMKEETAVQVFLNTRGNLNHIGSIYTGQQLGYNWLKFGNGKIEVNYNTVYNGAAGYSDPKTFIYEIKGEKIVEIINPQNE